VLRYEKGGEMEEILRIVVGVCVLSAMVGGIVIVLAIKVDDEQWW
jgi:integral membrane sensor domain MASE1